MGTMKPWRNGSVLDDFNQRWMVVVGSMETSVTVRWTVESKAEGHVNSATLRNPKKAREDAVQNMIWSKEGENKEWWMTSSNGPVMGEASLTGGGRRTFDTPNEPMKPGRVDHGVREAPVDVDLPQVDHAYLRIKHLHFFANKQVRLAGLVDLFRLQGFKF